jgi:sugar phosphate isomerase/epimerase
VFCELGAGCFDLSGFLRELKAQRFEGWVVVEQDVLGEANDKVDPASCAQRARQVLRALGI